MSGIGIRPHFGFGQSPEKRLAQAREKYLKELKEIKKDIKELYKAGVNENAQPMVDLERAVDGAERLASQSSYVGYVAARERLEGTGDLVKAAKSQLKEQQTYREEMKGLRAKLKELRYVLGDNDERLQAMRRKLATAEGAAATTRYEDARAHMTDVREDIHHLEPQVPEGRKEFIKELEGARAALKQLEVLGLRGEQDHRDIEDMIRRAEEREATLARPDSGATEIRWEEARHILYAYHLIMKKASVVNRRKETEGQLASGEFMNNAEPEDWANAVIDLFGLTPGLRKGDLHDVDVKIGIPPGGYKKYKALQEQIAGKGLEEYQRPTIDLTVKGKNAPVTSFGIIGGTGPLSDAEMLEKTMQNLEGQPGYDPDRVHIRLLSAPPPREVEEGSSPRKKARYVNRTRRFCTEPHSKMALASNTAHMNIGSAQRGRAFARAGRKNKAGPGPHQVQDLSATVVERIMADRGPNGAPPRPLIMGTKGAYDYGDDGLYAAKFGEAGVTASNVAPKDSIKLQAWIDDTKRGVLTEDQKQRLKDEVKTFIKAELRRQPGTTHLVLACTELPLALGGHDGIAALQAELAAEKIYVKLFDTEACFAEEYTKMTNENSGQVPPAAGHAAGAAAGPLGADAEEGPARLELNAVERDAFYNYFRAELGRKIEELPAEQRGNLAGKVENVATVLLRCTVEGTMVPAKLGDDFGISEADLNDLVDEAPENVPAG
jgi:aspartate/glutamate racemase